jgi:uncharacterized protein (DUF58 family)
MARSGLRLAGVSRHALVIVLIGFALFGIARTTGSGWLVVLLAGLIGMLVVAAVLPIAGLRRVDISVEAPRDATAGRPLTLDLRVSGSGALRLRCASPRGPWSSASLPAEGSIEVVPERRGVLEDVTFELRGSAPLGLVPWRRMQTVRLPHAIDVGPMPIDTELHLRRGRVSGAGDATTQGFAEDDVRGARAYVPGDPLRLIHWHATARTGELMVKELEAPARAGIAVIVDLRSRYPEENEEAAGRAAGIALGALRNGIPVTLLTVEAGGPVVAAADSPSVVSRRLARAIDGAAPPDSPIPPGAGVVRVSPQGIR